LATSKKPPKSVTETTLKRETARLGKDISQALTLLKSISAEVKSTAKAAAKISGFEEKFSEIEGEITALQKQVAEAAKAPKQAVKKPRKLSEMNLFVSEQIKSGKSFSEAIQAWKAYKASKAAPSTGPAESTETLTP